MENSLAKKIGVRIRHFRERRLSLSQEELSERADVHVTHLSRLENGVRLPTIETLLRIANGLNVPVCEIIPSNHHASPSKDDAIIAEILRIMQTRPPEERKAILHLLKTYYSPQGSKQRG